MLKELDMILLDFKIRVHNRPKESLLLIVKLKSKFCNCIFDYDMYVFFL